MRAGWRMGAALAALLGLGMAGAAARAETLTDALIAAYKNSNLLEQNRALLRAADEDVAISVAALRPALELSADLTNSNQRIDQLQASLALSAQLNVLDFGRNRLAVEAAKETVLATRESLINVEQQVLLAAVSAYVSVRLNEDIVAVRQANTRLIAQELRAANDRFDVGANTRTDVALAEAALAAARSDLIAAQGDLMIAREDYKLATGAYPGRLAPLPRLPRLPGTLDEARAIAERTHPSIRQAQRQVTVADLNTQRAKASTRPSVDFSVSVGRNDSGTDTRSVGLSLGQTLYAGGQLSALYRQAIANTDAARSGLYQTVAEISQQVGVAWANLNVAAASIESSDRQIEAAQTAFDGVRQEAQLGARTTLDVLDAEQDLLEARTGRLSSVAARYTAAYQLLSTMGLLTADHLGLGIPTYDPAAYYNAVKNAPATSVQGRRLDRILERAGRAPGN